MAPEGGNGSKQEVTELLLAGEGPVCPGSLRGNNDLNTAPLSCLWETIAGLL